jgi:hypothetical protein
MLIKTFQKKPVVHLCSGRLQSSILLSGGCYHPLTSPLDDNIQRGHRKVFISTAPTF